MTSLGICGEEQAKSVDHFLGSQDTATEQNDIGEWTAEWKLGKQAAPSRSKGSDRFLIEGAGSIKSHNISFSPYLDSAVGAERARGELVCVSFGSRIHFIHALST